MMSSPFLAVLGTLEKEVGGLRQQCTLANVDGPLGRHALVGDLPCEDALELLVGQCQGIVAIGLHCRPAPDAQLPRARDVTWAH